MSGRFNRNPRFGRTPANATITLIVLVVLVAIRLWKGPEAFQQTPPAAQPAPSSTSRQDSPSVPSQVEGKTARVLRAVDGDTLLLENRERVRLLGIDTPESKIPDTPPEPFGVEAAEFTARMTEGKTVRLEFDRERFDQYQRTLAYVYVGDLLLNEEIIRQGFSRAVTHHPYRDDMKRRFREAEADARRRKAGIWISDNPPRPVHPNQRRN